jgi:hypothetical protein
MIDCCRENDGPANWILLQFRKGGTGGPALGSPARRHRDRRLTFKEDLNRNQFRIGCKEPFTGIDIPWLEQGLPETHDIFICPFFI